MIALITGASSGIGAATARKMISEGWIVYGLARDKKGLESVDGVRPLVADMTDSKSLEKALKQLLSEENRIDVLVNNAGYGLYGTIEDVPLDAARDQFEVNVFGLARLTQLVLPFMRERNSGTIINISSMAGKIYTPLGGWYHASKYVLEGLSDCLRLETKAFNLKVVLIEPGAINTPWGKTARDNLTKYSGNGAYAAFAEASAKATLQAYDNPDNLTSPEEVANIIYKAATSRNPKSRYVVGKFARPLLLIHKFLGDRVYDWLAMRAVHRYMSN